MPNDLLTVEVEQEGDALVLRPSGELDISTTKLLDAELRLAISGDAAEVILDLSDLTFIDSSGLRLLALASAHSRANGDRLRLLRGPEQVERVIHLSCLDQSLPFID